MTLYFAIPTLNNIVGACDLLDQAYRAGSPPDELILIDNGQQGKLPDRPDYVFQGLDRITPKRNLGVAASWNLVLERMQPGDIAIISNDDISISEHTIGMMADALQSSAESVVVGPRIHPYSFFAITYDAVESIGFFDEQFWPAYFEDDDYRRRLRLAGWKEHFLEVDQLGIKHEDGGTKKRGDDALRASLARSYRRSAQLYEAKWLGSPSMEQALVPYTVNR